MSRLQLNHHSIITADEVNNICKSFFSKTGINTFLYAKIFDNDTCFGLVSNKNWQSHHFNQQYPITPKIPKHILSKDFFYLITPNTVPTNFSQAMNDFRNILDMDYPLVMIERKIGYYELYMFFTHLNNEGIINFYLNNIHMLEKFKLYFKDKAKKLILSASKNIIHIPTCMRSPIRGIQSDISLEHPFYNDSHQKIIRYPLPENFGETYLTEMEFICLSYTSQGYTIKEIGKILHRSERTVESHINHIKVKLKCVKKSHLSKIFFDHLHKISK
jgi:DNA-binding CsgD family transcriptional regulator